MVGETNYEKQKQFEYDKHLLFQTILGKAILAMPMGSQETSLSSDYQSQTNLSVQSWSKHSFVGEARKENNKEF